MTDNIEIPIPEPVKEPVTTIVQAPREELEHVVAHEGRITQIEERQTQHAEAIARQIDETRKELFAALESARTEQASLLESKLSRLDELAVKLEQQVTAPLEKVGDTLEEPLKVVPEVEQTVTKVIPKGLRQRRKMRHKG